MLEKYMYSAKCFVPPCDYDLVNCVTCKTTSITNNLCELLPMECVYFGFLSLCYGNVHIQKVFFFFYLLPLVFFLSIFLLGGIGDRDFCFPKFFSLFIS